MIKMTSIPLIFAATFILMFTIYSNECQGASKAVPIDGMVYNLQYSMADNLKYLVGKQVTVTLDSGSTFSGKVKNVGDHLLHLERIEGKDFNDALMKIDKIIALDARFWEYKK